MKYATQITNSSTAWIPGIHRKNTKREAVAMADAINRNTSGKVAHVIRKRTETDAWEQI